MSSSSSPDALSADPSPGQSSFSQASVGRSGRRAWVQSGLAIAAGSLFLALSVIVLRAILLLQNATEFTSITFCILALIQLSLTTAGGYVTALLAQFQAPLRPNHKLIRHVLGLAALACAFCLISALTSNGQDSWTAHMLALFVALSGIGTGTWLHHRQSRHRQS